MYDIRILRSAIRLSMLLVLGLMSSLSFAAGQSVSISSLLDDLTDVDHLAAPPFGIPSIWSSFDRTGGDDDGHGFIRQEDGRYVIAEMDGPGAITRMWFSQPSGTIDIFLDDGSKPEISRPVTDLLTGKWTSFTTPFSSWNARTKDGFTWLPITYNRFCKVTASHLGFYQIEYLTFPSKTKVGTFQNPMSRANSRSAAAAAKQLRPPKTGTLQNHKDVQMFSYAETIPAGETIELVTYTGPAWIRGIECKWQESDLNAGRDMVLALFWDDESAPSVLVPVFDLFGGGGQTNMVGVDGQKTAYCYFPMPFTKQACVHLINDNLEEERSLDITFYVQPEDSMPKAARYFCVDWKRENDTMVEPFQDATKTLSPPFEPSRNTVLMNRHASGHVAGIGIVRTGGSSGDFMLIADDGDTSTWADCGQDGLFNGKRQNKLDAGLFTSVLSPVKDYTSQYRIFPFPYPFQKKIWFSMEHGHANLQRMDIASTVYWYKDVIPTEPEWLPPWQARMFRTRPLKQPDFVYTGTTAQPQYGLEGEQMDVVTSSGIFEPQDMSPFGPDWSNNQQLLFDGSKPGASIVVRIPKFAYSGWYLFSGLLSKSPYAGIVTVRVQDRAVVSSFDLYDTTHRPVEVKAEDAVFIHAGEEILVEFTLEDQNADALGLTLGIDRIALQASPIQPKQLSAIGPLLVKPPKPEWVQYQNRSDSGLATPLGYHEPSTTLEPKSLSLSKGIFSYRESAKSNGDTPAYVFLTWEVNVDRSGIYRFELEPSEAVPAILTSGTGGFTLSSGRIWVNGVALQGDATVRYSGVSEKKCPMRFPVPLHDGDNRISWMLDVKEADSFLPHLYGILP